MTVPTRINTSFDKNFSQAVVRIGIHAPPAYLGIYNVPARFLP